MSIFDRFKKRSNNSLAVWLGSRNEFDTVCGCDYTPLDRNPEVVAACRTVADLISSMTIYLQANTESGDIRIVNELSRKVDINPWSASIRKNWMDSILMTLMLYGKGNSTVLPTFSADGYIEDLEPIAAHRVEYRKADTDVYRVVIDGKPYNPNDVLHFVYNPDKRDPWKGMGVTVYLKDVVKNLAQATKTNYAFMSSKWKPSMVVMVDGLVDEFSSPEGRRRLRAEYLENNEAGAPWMIPANQFKVEQIRPLSLSDLAINDSVQLDKGTVASLIGVPSFALGVGEFDKEEWNNFVNTKIHAIAESIEQELTKKLLLSEKMYWRLNIASLYAYDLQATASVYSDLYTHGIVTGNEVRDKIGMEPKKGLDDLVVLENYIPLGKIGNQSKLNGDADA